MLVGQECWLGGVDRQVGYLGLGWRVRGLRSAPCRSTVLSMLLSIRPDYRE